MKKKLFRERYYGETTITAEKAIKLIDEGVKKLKEEKKSTKKGRKKND
jgi:hypothetical protein